MNDGKPDRMDEALAFIYRRRSIRKYEDRPVEDEKVAALLRAAMSAPSAVAKDPWRFIVVKERANLAKIAEGLPNGKMLAGAGVGFVVCGDIEAANIGEISYLLQDCSAAIENILLGAEALGLGGVWLGVHPREDRMAHIRSVLALPEHFIPVSVLSIGYPAETREARTRFNPAYVGYERWRQ